MRLKLVTSLIVLVAIVNGQDPPTEEAVRQLLAQYDEELLDYCNPSSKASWAVQTFVGNATLVEELVSAIDHVMLSYIFMYTIISVLYNL